MKCDTSGFGTSEEPKIVDDLRGHKQIDFPRNNRKVVQSSLFLCRGWRANCDFQFIMCDCDPENPDPMEIARVTNYIVAYQCKGNESHAKERDDMKQLVLEHQEQEGDSSDVKKCAWKMLNDTMKQRMMSKQETCCLLAGLELFNCSETIEPISISSTTKIGTNNASQKSFLRKCADRAKSLHGMSLTHFFIT